MPKLSGKKYWQELVSSLRAEFASGAVEDAPYLPSGWVPSAFQIRDPVRGTTRVQLQSSHAPLVERGRHNIALATNFRGSPPGSESSRPLPWFILASAHGTVLGARWALEEQVLTMARAVNGVPVVQEHVTGIPYPLWIGASYPRASKALHSPIWEDRWKRWLSLTPSALDIVPPIFFGQYGVARLGLSIDPERDVRDYARLVRDFLSAEDDMERAFDAPLLKDAPPVLSREQVEGGGMDAHEAEFILVHCPKCGKLEVPHFVGRPIYNLIGKDCRAYVFGGPRAQP